MILQDLRFGIRQLRKNPGFTLIAVLTLALGIAVNATMFSMVSGFLLQRPPGRDPNRVAVISSVDPAGGFLPDTRPSSIPNYLAWKEANHVFEDIAAANESRTVSLTTLNQSEALHSAVVTPNYFSIFGVGPQLGRDFQPGDDQSGRDHVIILSHDAWASRFGSDPSIIGRTIRMDREPYTVVGVMPASFRLLGYTAQLWTPLTITPADQTAAARKERYLHLFARLKPGVTIEQARAEILALSQRSQESFPDSEKGWSTAVLTLPSFLIHDFSIAGGLTLIMATVGFVLMIACANVAGLLLARAAARKKELAIRSALGAGRLRIIRQLLTEGLVISLLGGALGLLLSHWGIDLIRANMSFNEAISSVPLSLDWNVVTFATVISLGCALLCGLAPALHASRTDITTNLKDESRAASQGRSQSRLRTAMVTAEIAMALFLLVGTGLLFRAIFMIEHQNLGFRADHLLTANITLDQARYKDASQQSLFVRDLLSRLQQAPGTESVAATSDLPASGPGSVSLRIKGQPDSSNNAVPSALDSVVTPNFFQTAGISLLHGRTFTDADDATRPRVVVVSQGFADRFFRSEDPIGKFVRLEVAGSPSEWSEIVGVVSNVKVYSESAREEPEVYEAFHQRPVGAFSLMLRSASDPTALVTTLRSTVAQLDPELPLARVMSMPSVLELQRGGDPFMSKMLGSFALLALLLAAIGIYGLIAYSVGQRTHEIGIRMALGARSQDVLRMVLREGMKMTAIGGTIGLVLALPLPKLFGAMFFDLHVHEPLLYVIVPATIVAVALLATYIPARRAARVEPMQALRQE